MRAVHCFSNSNASSLNSLAYFRYFRSSIHFLLMTVVYSIRTFFVPIISGEVHHYVACIEGAGMGMRMRTMRFRGRWLADPFDDSRFALPDAHTQGRQAVIRVFF